MNDRRRIGKVHVSRGGFLGHSLGGCLALLFQFGHQLLDDGLVSFPGICLSLYLLLKPSSFLFLGSSFTVQNPPITPIGEEAAMALQPSGRRSERKTRRNKQGAEKAG